MTAVRTYPSDVKDEEWSFVAAYLCLMSEDAPQRGYALRDVFNALRYLTHTGSLAVAAARPAALGHGLPARDALARCLRI